jgi:hypothetical protein
MRSLTILLILTALLLSATISNCIYINDISDRLLSKIEALPSPDAKEACKIKIDDLIRFWEQNFDTVCLSVSYTVADRISEQAQTLLSCARIGDLYGFYQSLTLLRDAVEDMRRMEDLSVVSLL